MEVKTTLDESLSNTCNWCAPETGLTLYVDPGIKFFLNVKKKRQTLYDSLWRIDFVVVFFYPTVLHFYNMYN